jgi:hypothetical protein
MEKSRLRQIAALMKSGNNEQARELLRIELREHPTADAWYLAAHVALSDQQRLAFLRKALELDPFHKQANRSLEKYQELDTQSSDLASDAPPQNIEAQLLERSVPIFNKYGWNMSLSTNTTKQFEKKDTIDCFAALALILVLNVLGLIFVVLSALGAPTRSVILQSTGQGYLLGMEKSHKEQHELRSEADIENFAKWGKAKINRGPAKVLWAIIFVLILILIVALILAS